MCQRRRRKARQAAAWRRRVLFWTLLAAVLPMIFVALYAASGGDWRLGWGGIFVAFGLIYFASEVGGEQ